MADTLVAADLDLSLDVLLNLASQVTLDLIVVIDEATDLRNLVVCHGPNPGVGIDPGLGTDLLGSVQPDAVDVRQRDL